jgi:hypothetical protein
MIIEPNDFRDRLRERAGLEGTDLTDAELSHLAESYASCAGKDPWDVRAYARLATVGAREYRVVRGHGVRDVFRSVERARATAVQAALNDLESQQDQGRTK